jgi:hypothetical protein
MAAIAPAATASPTTIDAVAVARAAARTQPVHRRPRQPCPRGPAAGQPPRRLNRRANRVIKPAALAPARTRPSWQPPARSLWRPKNLAIRVFLAQLEFLVPDSDPLQICRLHRLLRSLRRPPRIGYPFLRPRAARHASTQPREMNTGLPREDGTFILFGAFSYSVAITSLYVRSNERRDGRGEIPPPTAVPTVRSTHPGRRRQLRRDAPPLAQAPGS